MVFPGQFLDGHTVQDRDDFIPYPFPYRVDQAGGVVFTTPGAYKAAVGKNGALHRLHHFTQSDPVRGAGQGKASARASEGIDQTDLGEVLEDLGEERLGDP